LPDTRPHLQKLLRRHGLVALQRLRWIARGCTGPRDERSRVLPDEALLRRIHKNHYKFTKQTSVERVAFEPNKNDTDGLSVFRAAFVSPTDLVAGARDTYYVAKIMVAELQRFSPPLSVIPDSDPEQPPGHALIPEANFVRLKNEKYPSKELQRDLAKIASNNIVYRPGNPAQAPRPQRLAVLKSWLLRRRN
jgi:hypothetical protein